MDRKLKFTTPEREAFADLPAAETFGRTYAERLWVRRDEDEGADFHSGIGSHMPEIVEPYVKAMTALLTAFDRPPDIADLGCGDFAIGARLRPLARRYAACDVVAPLIERNRKTFADCDVDFHCVDLTREAPPPGEVAIIRTVFQHLSNADIAAALENIAGRYRWLVVTELLPREEDFTPNIDMDSSPWTRHPAGSGVVLTAPPFNLPVKAEQRIARIATPDSRLDTVLYEV